MSSHQQPNRLMVPVHKSSRYKPEYCKMLIEYVEEGGSLKGFAKKIGVSRTTLYNWAKAYIDFGMAYEEAKIIGEEGLDIIYGEGDWEYLYHL